VSRVVTGLVYLAVLVGMVLADVIGRRAGSPIPRFADIVRWAARRRSTQFGLLLAWWWLGWHFVLGA
jgi:hypothetical protein